MDCFSARLDIIGINPFVFVPQPVLDRLFVVAGRDKGPVPVHGTLNGVSYQQTLVRYAGAWRLYINTSMLPDSPRRVGETVDVCIDFDPRDRTLPMHPWLADALRNDAAADMAFAGLAPSLQQEVIRYLTNLKTEASVRRNVQRAMAWLKGEQRFIGREGISFGGDDGIPPLPEQPPG